MSTHSAPSTRRRGDSGFTLIEVLVALTVVAVLSVGAFGIVAGSAVGGLQEGGPVAVAAGRRAKDLTAAGVALQALHDYLAIQDGAVWDAAFSDWPPGATERTYCVRLGRASCAGSDPPLPATFGEYPLPGSHPYQLDWVELRVAVQRWFWDCASRRYAPNGSPTDDFLVRVRSDLTWRFRGQLRTLVPGDPDLDRFLPFRPVLPLPPGEVCA